MANAIKARRYLEMCAEDAKNKVYFLPNHPIWKSPHARKLVVGKGVREYCFGDGFHGGKHGLVHPDGSPCDATKKENCPLFAHPLTSPDPDGRGAEKPEHERMLSRRLEPEEKAVIEMELKEPIEKYNNLAERCQRAMDILRESNKQIEDAKDWLSYGGNEEIDKLEQAQCKCREFLKEHDPELKKMFEDIDDIVSSHGCQIHSRDIGVYGRLGMHLIRVPTSKIHIKASKGKNKEKGN